MTWHGNGFRRLGWATTRRSGRWSGVGGGRLVVAAVFMVLLVGVGAALADTWSSQTSGTSQQLDGVSCASSSDCVVVGGGGAIEATTGGGSSWSSQSSGLSTVLQSVACPSTSDCVSAGASGKILVTTNSGSSWSSETSGTSDALYGISCPSTSDCYTVGASGTILVSTNGGSSWSSQTSGTSDALYGVSCPSSSDCYAVGAGGTILVSTNGGSSWSSETSGTSDALYGVSCPSTSQCVAVGAGGTVLLSTNSGSSWTSETSGTSSQLNAVSCPSSSSCWAVGAGGTVLATTTTGSTWVSQTSGTTNALYGVSCVTGACWAVGASGTIVNTNAPSNTALPSISGTVQVGQALTAGSGTWSGSSTISYAYQWKDCTSPAQTSCSSISGATSSTYTLQTSDEGSYVAVQVTASNTAGSASALSASAVVASSSSYVGEVQAHDPVAFWPLDDASLPTVFDVSGNGNNGTFSSGVTTGMLDQTGVDGGGSLELAGGTSSYVQVPAGVMPATSTVAFTVQAWFKTSSASGVILGREDGLGGSASEWTPMLYIDSSGYLEGAAWYDGTGDTLTSSTPVDDGNWHEAVLTITSGGAETLFVDGVQQATGTLGAPTQDPGDATIGAGESEYWPDGSSSSWTGFDGKIADMALYNSALSQSTIDTQYDAADTAPGVVSAPSITGSADVGDTLTASDGTWVGTSPSYSYQWKDCTSPSETSCSSISGATSSTYVLQTSDEGSYVAVHVTATNSEGSASALSASTGLVASASSYVGEVQAHDPAAFWPLDDSSLPTALDISGNGNDGTFSSGVSTGMLDQTGFDGGGSLQLAGGTSSYVQVPVSTIPGSAEAFTAQVWFKTASATGVILGSENGLGGSASQWTPLLYVDSSGYLEGQLWYDESSWV